MVDGQVVCLHWLCWAIEQLIIITLQGQTFVHVTQPIKHAACEGLAKESLVVQMHKDLPCCVEHMIMHIHIPSL